MVHCECSQILELNQPSYLPTKSVKLCLCNVALLSIFDKFENKWSQNARLLENNESEVLVDSYLF